MSAAEVDEPTPAAETVAGELAGKPAASAACSPPPTAAAARLPPRARMGDAASYATRHTEAVKQSETRTQKGRLAR